MWPHGRLLSANTGSTCLYSKINFNQDAYHTMNNVVFIGVLTPIVLTTIIMVYIWSQVKLTPVPAKVIPCVPAGGVWDTLQETCDPPAGAAPGLTPVQGSQDHIYEVVLGSRLLYKRRTRELDGC